jgi:L-asparaginase
VLIVNTGGTIGMMRGADGALVPSPGYLAERLAAMREFMRPEMPATSLVELLPLIDSSDMSPADWDRIALTIEATYWRYDGFVVVMGTDTMAYAASALSFMLESLGKPVIVTGSMLPLSDLFNDAQRNVIVSVVIAGMLAVPEVCVFMDARLLRGNRTVKTNTDGLDAFDSPNLPPLATLETGIRLRSALVLPLPKGRFRVHCRLEKNIAVWRMIPGFSDEYIANAIEHSTSLRAIVVELCVGEGRAEGRAQRQP